MGALYSHTTRATGTLLTATIYNADHQNHIDNGTPGQLDDYSLDVSQMRTQTDPGEVGTESMATSLAGELERIRFMLKELKGTTYWYESISGNFVTNPITSGFPLLLEMGASIGDAIEISSTDDGSSVGPKIVIFRDSATPADGDPGGAWDWDFNTDMANRVTGVRMVAVMDDMTDTTEDFHLSFQTRQAGAGPNTRIGIGLGLYTASVGGGDKGVDTINAKDLYADGDQVLPLNDLSQLTAAASALLDRVLVRDSSAGDHMYMLLKDVGTWVVLAEDSPSAAATSDFVLTTYTDFEDFRLRFRIIPDNDNVELFLRTSTDGGSTYDATADYDYEVTARTANSSTGVTGTGENQIQLNGDSTIGNQSTEGIWGEITIINPAAAAVCCVHWTGGSKGTAGAPQQIVGMGMNINAANVDALRILASAGNITGKVVLEGRRKLA